MKKTEQQVRTILAIKSDIEPKYMMASTAYHLLGEISREGGDLCHINAETENFYVGSWVTGYGFVDVLYPKETTRELTPEEIEKYNKMYIRLASNPPQKLKVD